MRLLILITLIVNSAFAECDFSKIRQQGDEYVYSKDCHIEVGRIYKKLKERDAQVVELEKALSFKDLALNAERERANMWQDAAYKVEDRFLKLEKTSDAERWIWFGAGIVVMGAATYGASRMVSH